MVNQISPTLLIIVAAFVGGAAGYIGSFMVLRRMSLVGDALSHVALPGMAVAIIFHLSPILGAFVALMIAILGIWYFEENSTIYPEALVGIFFTTALAVGILITPEPDLLEALFGSIEKINLVEAAAAIAVCLIMIVLTKLVAKKLMLAVISKDLVKSEGISRSKTNLIYLILVGTVVALGIRLIGTLLTGSLVIIPAAAAKNVARSSKSYYFLAIFFGIAATVSGVIISGCTHIASGPMVVLSGIAIFITTYLLKNFLNI